MSYRILTADIINDIRTIKEPTVNEYNNYIKHIIFSTLQNNIYNLDLLYLYNYISQIKEYKHITNIQINLNKMLLIIKLINKFNIINYIVDNTYNKELFNGNFEHYIKYDLKTCNDIIICIDKLLYYIYEKNYDNYAKILCKKINIIKFIINKFNLDFQEDFLNEYNEILISNIIFKSFDKETIYYNNKCFIVNIDKYDNLYNTINFTVFNQSDNNIIYSKQFIISNEELTVIESDELYYKVKSYIYNRLLNLLKEKINKINN